MTMPSDEVAQLPQPGTCPDEVLLRCLFGSDGLAEVRYTAGEMAWQVGLAGSRLDDFVLVVTEIVANAIRHGGGGGELSLWSTGAWLHCQVADHGTGISAEYTATDLPPPSDQRSGRGLWLARRLSDGLTVTTSSAGTCIHSTFSIHGRRPQPGPPSVV